MLSTPKRRFGAFGGLILTLVAVVALSVATTGAYFTDSKPGQINGTNGTVTVNVSGGGGSGLLEFDFTGLLPGVAKTATINLHNPTADTEDIYLVFKNDNGIWSAANNLGQYGRFTVGGYVYDNLSNKYAVGPTPGQVGAPISGSYMGGSCSTINRVPINYLPRAIKVATLTSGGSHSFNVSFNYNACMTNHQNEAIFNPAGNDTGATIAPGPLEFAIVAFQAGVDPTSPFNGAGAIGTLNLTPYNLFNNQYIQY